MPGFVLLARDRTDGDDAVRLGFTVTKKVGNAVVRNRLKRRMRELARAAVPEAGRDGHDYVMIGREAGIDRDFAVMRTELFKALKKVSNSAPAHGRPIQAPAPLIESGSPLGLGPSIGNARAG